MKRALSAALAAALSLSVFCAAPVYAAEPVSPAVSSAAAKIPQTYEKTGSGNATLENVAVVNDLAAGHFSHTGTKAFEVKQTKSDGTAVELVNVVGKYDASIPVDTANPSTIQITADGDWSFTLNPGVYWGETGLKYHIDPNCTSFQGTAPQFGTIVDAETAGRIGWCLICSDGMGNWNKNYTPAVTSAAAPSAAAPSSAKAAPAPVSQKNTAASESGADSSGLSNLKDVPDTNEITGSISQAAYWTSGGKSYHFSRDCTSLKRSKKVNQGTLQDALNAGKKDPCNLCAGGN